MAIDFNKVQRDVVSKAEQIPTSNLKPTQAPVAPPNPIKPPTTPTKATKGVDNKRYSRVGFDPDVWQAMKVKKLMNDESFTDQVNNALRLYLNLTKK
jgi:hypothetical protein